MDRRNFGRNTEKSVSSIDLRTVDLLLYDELSIRKLHSFLAGGESECFGVFLSFKPKVRNAGVLGVQAILVDCRQGSQSQWVLRVAEYQG
jgi:hypothetical protein